MVNDSSLIEDGTVKFIDLFCGLGGIRIGLEQAVESAGFLSECVFSSDIKPGALAAYKANFGEDAKCDITSFDPSDIPDFDILLAGFPCQAFSQAGLGLGFEDTRGTLFFDVAKILKEKKPIAFLLENVEGLVGHDRGKTLKIILNTLEELEYKVTYSVLNARDFGLAQSRNRIYIVGIRSKEAVKLSDFGVKTAVLRDVIDESVGPKMTLFTKKLLSHFEIEELYGKAIKDKRGGTNNIHSWDIALKGEISEQQREVLEALLRHRRRKKWADEIGIAWMDGMPLTLEMIRTFFDSPNLEEMLDDLVDKGYLEFEHPKARVGRKRIADTSLPKGYNIVAGKLSFEFSKILSPNDVVPTLVATDVHKMAVPVSGGLRPLTVKEGLRLCGFPDDYSLDDVTEREAFDLIGNTVCVPVIRAVSERLIQAMVSKERS